MNNKILLLVSANKHITPYPVYPLGISYLKSYLETKEPGMKIHIFDFVDKSYDDYINCLNNYKPDYIGVSLRNIDDVNIYKQESFITHYSQIIQLSKKYSNSVVIIGGSGFSIYPELLFENLGPDFGICGEGEISLHQLIKAIEKKEDYSDIEGLLYKKNGLSFINKRSTRFKNPVLNFDTDMVDFYWQNSGMLNIQTKRGCPYKCIYCTYPLIEGSIVRTLTPDEIVDTISHLKRSKNIDYFFFTDSVFNISNHFNLELADKLIQKKLDIQWGGYFNFSNIDFNLLEKLKKAGLKHIEFGTESLSAQMLKNYNKPFSLKDVFEVCNMCNKLEIDFAHFLILGGYGETNDTIDETFENCKKIDHSVFFPFIGMRIYPNTKLQEIAIKENVIKAGDPLLEPVYYVSKNMDFYSLKEKAKSSGKRWIFPDEDLSTPMLKMRQKGKKGPLWEYLIE